MDECLLSFLSSYKELWGHKYSTRLFCRGILKEEDRMEGGKGEVSVKIISTSILLMQFHIMDIKTGLMIFLAATGDKFKPRQLCFEYILCWISQLWFTNLFSKSLSLFPCFRMSSDGSAIIHKPFAKVTVSFALLGLG